MRPVLFQIGSFIMPTYLFLLGSSFVLGTALLFWRARAVAFPNHKSIGWGLPVLLFVCAMIGSRYYWLIEYEDNWAWWEGLYFWDSGHVFYGGFLGGLAGAVAYAKFKGLPLLRFFDLLTPTLALGYAITRVGCFFNGCCYGKLSNLPWAVCYPRAARGPYFIHFKQGLLSADAPYSLPVHPAPLYAAFALLVVYFSSEWIIRHKNLRPGQLFVSFLFSYGLIRFSLEFFRADSPVYGVFSWKAAQYVSITLSFSMAVIIFINHRRTMRKKARLSKIENPSSGFSLVELLVVIGIITLLSSIILPALSRAQDASKRAACQNNLRQLGMTFQMYASEDTGEKYPPVQFQLATLSKGTVALSPRLDSLYPAYLTDLDLLRCPSNSVPAPLNNSAPELTPVRDYVYWGWALEKCDAVHSDITVRDLFGILPNLDRDTLEKLPDTPIPAQCYALLRSLGLEIVQHYFLNPDGFEKASFLIANSDKKLLSTIKAPLGNGDSRIIHRLSVGVEKHLYREDNTITTSSSDIWVMFDSISDDTASFNHLPGGANVLYLDGHVDYHAFPASSPISREMRTLLSVMLPLCRDWSRS